MLEVIWREVLPNELQNVDGLVQGLSFINAKFKTIFIWVKADDLITFFLLLFSCNENTLINIRRSLLIFAGCILYDLLRDHSYALDESLYVLKHDLLCLFSGIIHSQQSGLLLVIIFRVLILHIFIILLNAFVFLDFRLFNEFLRLSLCNMRILPFTYFHRF